MAWDRTRPVPWQRLIRDWLIYVAIMTVVLAIVYRDRLTAGLFGGLLVSGPVFVLMGALLAKLGYQRKTLKQLRRELLANRVEHLDGVLLVHQPAAAEGDARALQHDLFKLFELFQHAHPSLGHLIGAGMSD